MLTKSQKERFIKEENISNKLKDIFIDYDPCSDREISFGELSEILMDISKIFKGDELVIIKKRESIQFLSILEELGILSEDQRSYLQCAKIKVERRGNIETWEFPIYFFTNNEELVYELLRDQNFIKNECNSPFCVSFLFCPFYVEVCDPSEMFKLQPLKSEPIKNG